MSQEAQNYEAHNVLRNFLLGAQTSVYQKIYFFQSWPLITWKTLLMFVPHPNLGSPERRLFTLRKSTKWIALRLIDGFPPFPLLSALIKQASFCLCFRRKAIYCSFQFSIMNFTHYKISGWVMVIKRSLHLIFVYKSMYLQSHSKNRKFFGSDLHFLTSS